MASVILNGITYTDDADPTTGMANGGHRTRFVPSLSNFLIEAGIQIALAADEVTQAAAQVTLAEGQVALAADQVALATAQKNLALTYANNSATSADESAASAITSANAPNATSTSLTSLTIDLSDKTLTTQANKSYITGQWVLLVSTASPTNYMLGQITTYNSTSGSMQVDILNTFGAGTFSAWSISVTAANFNAEPIVTTVASEQSIIISFFLG